MRIYDGKDGRITFLDLDSPRCRVMPLPFVPAYCTGPRPWRWGSDANATQAYEVATALLTHVLGRPPSRRTCCEFADSVVADLPAGWTLTSDDIEVWLGLRPFTDVNRVIGKGLNP